MTAYDLLFSLAAALFATVAAQPVVNWLIS